jgi:hypothetical protein
MFMSLQPFLWLYVTGFCSGDSYMDIVVDCESCGEVRSEA